MTLTDASAIFALIDRRQDAHEKCYIALRSLVKPLLTPWPCFTEAMYFAHKSGGWSRQQALWQLVNSGLLRLHSSSDSEIARMQVLMAQYKDTPMDMADAALVAAAEALNATRIFTLDSDFHVYRKYGGATFEVVP